MGIFIKRKNLYAVSIWESDSKYFRRQLWSFCNKKDHNKLLDKLSYIISTVNLVSWILIHVYYLNNNKSAVDTEHLPTKSSNLQGYRIVRNGWDGQKTWTYSYTVLT